MNTHKNARLTYARRHEMVSDMLERHLTPCAAAAAHGVSVPTAREWLGRYLALGEAGEFNEDWRLMNRLNFVFKPHGFSSREEMDALYNWHIMRFYNSPTFRRRFVRRLWQHRWSLWHLLKHVPQTVAAMRYFHANREELERIKREFKRHPRQPVGLMPILSPEIEADNRAASAATRAAPVKMSWTRKPQPAGATVS